MRSGKMIKAPQELPNTQDRTVSLKLNGLSVIEFSYHTEGRKGSYFLKEYLLLIVRSGVCNALSMYWERYRKPLLIAENGFGTHDRLEDGTVHDDYRISCLGDHTEQVGRAIHEGTEVIAYCAWGPIDIVSCSSQQMSKRYGFIYADLDNLGQGTCKRYKKDRFHWYKQVIATNGAEV